jgi:hypothetical protein
MMGWCCELSERSDIDIGYPPFVSCASLMDIGFTQIIYVAQVARHSCMKNVMTCINDIEYPCACVAEQIRCVVEGITVIFLECARAFTYLKAHATLLPFFHFEGYPFPRATFISRCLELS